MDKKVGMIIAGAGLLYLATRKSGPSFYDMQGRAIDAAMCGTSATFDVPGYNRVWLSSLKDGTLVFDGPHDVPMPAYIFSCATDIGAYEVAVYEIDANDVKGKLIGQTSFTIHARE